MIVIFDLDYTLLDAARLKDGLAKVMGMSLENWLKSYQVNFKDKGVNYNLDNHLKLLGKENDEALRKKIAAFLNRLDQYLFGGAEELLKRLKPDNRLVMLSYGDKKWQRLKIDHLKIEKYFDEIIYVDRDKSELADLVKNDNNEIIIVNDNAREGLAMRENLKNSQLYIVNGPYSRNVEHQEKIYTWEELEKIL